MNARAATPGSRTTCPRGLADLPDPGFVGSRAIRCPIILRRLEHEYSLRQMLDPAWSARPIAMAILWDRQVLVLGDPGGVPRDHLLGRPLDLPFALRLAISLSNAITLPYSHASSLTQ